MSDTTVTSMISQAQIQGDLSGHTFDLKGSIRDFYDQLTTLLRDYGDPSKDMVIDGIVIKADQKYQPYGALVFNNKINTLEQVQTTLLDVYTSIFTMEKNLTATSA